MKQGRPTRQGSATDRVARPLNSYRVISMENADHFTTHSQELYICMTDRPEALNQDSGFEWVV